MEQRRKQSGVQRVSLGVRIRFERQRKGWTQGDLARESGFDVDQIARFESGQATPSEADATRIATSLAMTLTALCVDSSASATRRGIG